MYAKGLKKGQEYLRFKMIRPEKGTKQLFYPITHSEVTERPVAKSQ